MSISNVALITGVTGITGLALARHLVGCNTLMKWDKVYGLSRKPSKFLPQGVVHVPCDLLDQRATKSALENMADVTHIFHATYSHHDTEENNIKYNTGAFRNLLHNFKGQLRHVALETGTRYYMGPFDVWASKTPQLMRLEEIPFKEGKARHAGLNFIYESEDVLLERAEKMSFTWSVARPYWIMGISPGNVMNIASIIAVYATICKESKRPFQFPGTLVSYDVFADMTDSDFLARHLEWEAASPSAKNQAFNVVNGDVFRWRFMWPVIAEYFGLEPEGPGEQPMNFEVFVKDNANLWDSITKKYNLEPYRLGDVLRGWVANVYFTTPCSVMSDMNKSREAGFLVYQNSEKSLFKIFDEMKKMNLLPSF